MENVEGMLRQQIIENMISISDELMSKDEVGAVLRASFYLEEAIDGFIKRQTGYNLYEGIQATSGEKLRICQNIGMPMHIYKALGKVFRARNDLAHRNTGNKIVESHIDSLKDILNNISGYVHDTNSERYGAEIFDERGNRRKLVIYRSASNLEKYIILWSQIYARIAHKLLLDEEPNVPHTICR